jgi:hypothetical protein
MPTEPADPKQDIKVPTHEGKTPFMIAIGVVLGCLCGALHIWLEDPLLTPLAVLASTMIMGTARPYKPWRWIIFVGLPVPIVTAIAVATGYVKVWDRALIAAAILSILVGCAGSIGGSVIRRFFDHVFVAQK